MWLASAAIAWGMTSATGGARGSIEDTSVERLALADGDPCSTEAECESGHCVDRVCCESECSGECEACSGVMTGGEDGICAPLPADVDLQDECAPDPDLPESCGADGLCDGEGACRRFAKRGTACGPTTCENGIVSGLVCNGDGECGTDDVACTPYACGGPACWFYCDVDVDCAAGMICQRRVCQEKSDQAAVCHADRECATGHCADAVCCDAACAGTCESCAEPGTEGTCTPVAGDPRGDRDACPMTDVNNACSQTRCDGSVGETCEGYVDDEVVCGATTCVDGVATREGTCDGAGACAWGNTSDCGAYVCAGPTCGTTCAADVDCATGFRCELRRCVPVEATTSCDADGVTLHIPGEADVDCAPFACQGTACLSSCTTASDCAPDHVCKPGSWCERVAASTLTEDGGCGCRTAGDSRFGSRGLAPLLLLALLCRRRLSRRRGRAHGTSV